jgi:flagellar protein export ATPase FliI
MSRGAIDLRKYIDRLKLLRTIDITGRVSKVVGFTIEARGIKVPVGEICKVYPHDMSREVLAEVVGFRGEDAILMPLGDMTGISPSSKVVTTGKPLTVKVGRGLLGRILNGLGEPMDGLGPIEVEDEYPVYSSPPHPLKRSRITEMIVTGVRAIDLFASLGKGQRIGIFGGSGIGKSVLLGMTARYTEADVSVIALIGERGREVREFIEEDLGEEGLKRSVVVVATSDQPALMRIRGAFLATAIAEYFRDQGHDVMFMMDSITRFAVAQREVGLSAGEPPTTRGYTPSVFALLPKLLERTGCSESEGSITGIYTILVEGDDLNEPISDAVRAILDGHIVLSRELASRNHYPAIDILNSLSRLMVQIASEEHQRLAAEVRELLAVYKEKEDLVNVGAYVRGSDPKMDRALKLMEPINRLLRQDITEKALFPESLQKLKVILSSA